MEWILIIILNGGAVNSAYFSSKDLCNEAKTEIEKAENNLLRRVNMYCVQGK